MELKHLYRITISFISFFAFFNLVGFTGLEKYVELENFVNGRNSAQFESTRKNISAILSEGTRGEILNNTQLPSGNFGLQIKVMDGVQKGKVFWVYYNMKNPRLALYKTLPAKDTSRMDRDNLTANPEQARGAQTTSDQRAYRDTSAEPQSALRPRSNPVPSIEPSVSAESLAQLIGSGTQALSGLRSERTSRCADCVALPAQCSQKNSYIESDLIDLENSSSALMKTLVREPMIRGFLDKKCVQAAQRQFTPKAKFAVCSDNNQLNYGEKPCASDRLANVVTNSFNLALRCMGGHFGNSESAKSRVENLFKMVQIESGFHLNPVSFEGASGLGQFLPGAVEHVNRNAFENIKNEFANSAIPICQEVAKEILNQPMAANDVNNCDRTSVKSGNPMKSLIYTIAYFKANRDYLEKEIFKKSEYTNRINLSDSEKSNLLDSLARWTHNSGPGGMSRPLKALILNEFSSEHKVTAASEILNKLPKYMISHPHPAFVGKPITAYISQYYNKSEAAAANLEQSIGVNCVHN